MGMDPDRTRCEGETEVKAFNIVMVLSWLFIAAVILFFQRDVDWWAALVMSIAIALNHLKDIFQND